MEIPRPRHSRRLPRPRAAHAADRIEKREEGAEIPSTSAAAIGEIATNPDQIRLKNIVETARAAARARQERSGDTTATEFEFNPVTGKQIREKAAQEDSAQLAQAAQKLGISDKVEATLLYAFPAEEEPEGVTLMLIKPDAESYNLVEVAEMPSIEGESASYSATVETVSDLESGAIPLSFDSAALSLDKPDEVRPLSEEEMAEYQGKVGRQAGHGEISDETQEEMAEHLVDMQSTGRSLTSSEIEALSLVNKAIMDLQPPLPD